MYSGVEILKQEQKDNTTLLEKVRLRRSVLEQIDQPIVMETNGGFGKVWSQVYRDIEVGIVFDKDAEKAEFLAEQRPTWAVYECDCVMALQNGIGAELPINLLDVDPYGQSWEIISAFFGTPRAIAPTLHVVVNDGIAQNLQRKTGWKVKSLAPMVERFGNNLYSNYEQICQLMMEEKAAQAGYRLSRWHIEKVSTGRSLHNYHYWAELISPQ